MVLWSDSFFFAFSDKPSSRAESDKKENQILHKNNFYPFIKYETEKKLGH